MSPSNRVTIPDLADELGLSVGTVSSALNGKSSVAESTRKRVLDLARLRGYKFNTAARGLRFGRPTTFALHVPLAARTLSYYMQFAIGFADAAATVDVDVVLSASNAAGRGEAFRVDGAAVADWEASSGGIEELIHAQVPVVAADGFPCNAPSPAAIVQVDYHGQIHRILESARAGGATRVALVAPDDSLQARWTTDVIDACAAACAEFGLPMQTARFPIFGTSEDLTELVRSLLADADAPDCIVFGGQNLAGYAASNLQLGTPGSAVPWIASCAGDQLTEIGSSTITAIDANPIALGARCATLLHELVTAESAPSDPIVEPWPSTIAWGDHWPRLDA